MTLKFARLFCSDQKTAIANGPSFEDFVEGIVEREDKWENYSEKLIRTKGVKR